MADDRSPEQKRLDSLALLEAQHEFPGPFMFKVIGYHREDFLMRVLQVFRVCQQTSEDPPYRTRETASGRHIAVTVEPEVGSANEVLEIYAEIRRIEGVVMVL